MPSARMTSSQQFTAEDRRQFIGASEIAALLGLDRYQTPLDIYNSKLGLVAPFEGNQHTMRGQRLEAIAADYYSELTGRKLRRYTRAYTHHIHSFIHGHIDRIVEGEGVIAEIKSPSIAAYRKIQREGIPDSWQIQMQVYMGLSGHDKCVVIVFCADAFDIAHFELSFDETIYAAGIAAAERFWTCHVLTQTPPELPAAGKKPEFELAKTDGTVTYRDDESFVARSVALVEAMQLKADAEQLFEIAKTDLLSAIEDTPGVYECAGMLRVHYNERPGRKTFDKKRLAAEHPEINLADYDKEGNPYREFRPYILKGA